MTELSPPIIWLNPNVPPPNMTPADENIFFGFHDITPWSPAGDEIVCLRLAAQAQNMADTSEEAQVSLWHPENGELRNIASTTCWNYQQAARQQWVPGTANILSYNKVDAGGNCIAELIELATGKTSVSQGGLYAISPDGSFAISPDFAILAKRWPAYGYASLIGANSSVDPAEFGLWRNDLIINRRELMISLAQVIDHWGADSDGSGHFLTHPLVSSDGEKIVFLHRFFALDQGSFTRLLVCNADGSGLTALAEEKVSHFDWLDPDTLLVWARFAGSGLARMRAKGTFNLPLIRPVLNLARKMTGRWKKRVLSESYFSLKVDGSGQRHRAAWPELDADGHPMVARRHDWVVTDMYPDQSGELPLILWNRKTRQRIDVARFHDGTATNDSDAKCDLHPRWNRDETMIAVDCCADGRRRIAVFDVSALVIPKA